MSKILKGVLGLVIAAVVLWVGYAAYTRQAAEEAPAGPVKIGWIGPLTGGAASYGESIKRGVDLALQELNPGTIEVMYEDGKCEGRDAVNAATKLISINGVVAIIGEVCSGATLAVAPVATQNQVVLLSPSSTSPKLSEAGEFMFRTIPSDALQGEFGAELVYERGHRKLAILYSNEEYGLGFSEVLSRRFVEIGGEVVANEAFGREDVDLRTQITKVKEAAPDAVYIIVNNPETAVAALKQLTELGVTVARFGSEGLKAQDIVDDAGAAATGLVVTSVSSGTSGFTDRHRAVYGADPGPFAAQGYDAMRAIALAVLSGAKDGPSIAAALRDLSFEGASGMIDFDERGDIAGNYDVVEVRDGKFVPVVQ